jgi:hypothetical protein
MPPVTAVVDSLSTGRAQESVSRRAGIAVSVAVSVGGFVEDADISLPPIVRSG